ncbi:MAG: RNA methyltransferase [Bacilli bacterium]|jgi:TrmH family RNA methyltransferase
MKTIDSKDNKQIKEAISLYFNKERQLKGLFLIEGFHTLEMALQAKKVVRVFSLKPIDNLPESVEQYIVNESVMKKLSKNPAPQGVVAICHLLEAEPIIGNAIYLDEISDPGNLGTILRSALAFGFINVIISSNSVSPYNEKVVASSQGAIFKLNIIVDGDETLSSLHKNGYFICGTSLDENSSDYRSIKLKKPFVLAFGNESRGLSDKVKKNCDKNVMIKIADIDSLNVGVAAGILLNYYSND